MLLHTLETLFTWLLTASWQASVLALLVLAIQWTLRGQLNPRWRYALWLLVIVRLLLPALPESALSLFQFTPHAPVAFVAPMTEPFLAPVPLIAVTPLPAPEPAYPFSPYSLLALVWLIGALVLIILTWQVNRRFAHQIHNSPDITDPELLRLFIAAKTELNVRRSIRLIENSQVQSPAIMGLFRPTLLLPANVRDKFDATELRLIFLHELAHLKRGDIIAQGLIALLQILHWFNPVLWFAFRRMRIDREPATDALVLSRTGEDEKERYGLMLIKLLEHFHQRHSLTTLVGILEDKDQFKRRFSLIAHFTRGAYGWSLLGVLVITLLGIAGLTRSKLEDSPSTVASTTDAEAKQKGIAVIVNNHVITIDDLKKQWQPVENDLRAKYSGKELQEQLIAMGHQLPITMANRWLMVDEFKAQGESIPKSFIDARIDDIVKDQYGGNRSGFLQTLAARGISEENYRQEIEEAAIIASMRNKFVEDKVDDYYETHLDLFPADEQLRVTFAEIKGSVPVSVGPTEDFASEADPRARTARDILQKMEAGADVSSLPPTEGIDPTDFGKSRWVTQNRFPGWWPITWTKIKELKPGETTGVIIGNGSYSSKNGPAQNYHYYYIIRLDERRPAKVAATEETAKDAKALLDAERQRLTDEWLAPLRVKAKIHIFNAALTVDPWALASATPTSTGATELDFPDAPEKIAANTSATNADVQILKVVQKGNTPVNATDETPFFRALEKNHTLTADSSVKSSTLEADGQMLRDIQDGQVADLKRVLNHAVDPNTFDPDRFFSYPVYWAVHFNQPQILKLLLDHMASGTGSPTKETPLQLAQKIHPDMVPILQEGMRNAHDRLTTQLTDKLHSLRMDLPSFTNIPLDHIVSFLLKTTSSAGYLERGVTIGSINLPSTTSFTVQPGQNISMWEALQKITESNKLKFYIDGSSIILCRPVDEAHFRQQMEATHITPLPSGHSAIEDKVLLGVIKKGDVAALRRFLSLGGDVKNRPISNPVYLAVYYDRADMLQMLLDHDASTDIDGPNGQSALALAKAQHPDLVPMLKAGIKHNREIHIAALTAKLYAIHLAHLSFENATLETIFQTLTEKAKQADPDDEGVNFVFRRPHPTQPGPDPANPLITVTLNDVTLEQALFSILAGTPYKYTVEEHAIYIAAPDTITANSSGGIPSSPASPTPVIPSTTPPVGDRVQLKLVVGEINEDTYTANQKKVDEALETGNLDLFNHLKGVNLYSTPSVTTQFGTEANLDMVREYSYPASFETDKNGETYPANFQKTEVGVKSRLNATQQDDRIRLYVTLTAKYFEGFADSNLKLQTPTFRTVETNLIELVEPTGQLKGIWIPGAHFEERTVTERDYKGKFISSEKQVLMKRLFVFLSATQTK